LFFQKTLARGDQIETSADTEATSARDVGSEPSAAAAERSKLPRSESSASGDESTSTGAATGTKTSAEPSLSFAISVRGLNDKDKIAVLTQRRDACGAKALEILKKCATNDTMLTELFLQTTKELQRKQRAEKAKRRAGKSGATVPEQSAEALLLQLLEQKKALQKELEVFEHAEPFAKSGESLIAFMAKQSEPFELDADVRWPSKEPCVIC